MEHHHWNHPKGVCQHWSVLIIVVNNLLLPNNLISTYNVAIKRPLRSTSSLKAEADIEGKAFMERKGISLVGVLGFEAEISTCTEIRLEQRHLLASIHTDTQTRQMRLTLVQPTGLYFRTCFTKDYRTCEQELGREAIEPQHWFPTSLCRAGDILLQTPTS